MIEHFPNTRPGPNTITSFKHGSSQVHHFDPTAHNDEGEKEVANLHEFRENHRLPLEMPPTRESETEYERNLQNVSEPLCKWTGVSAC